MKNLLLLFCTIIALSLTSCRSKNMDTGISNQTMLIYNANIINVKDGSILKNRAILIESSKIRFIDDYSTLKSLAKATNQIDAKNKFVIPGLWDNHVHIEGQDLVEDNKALFPVYLAYGITTVRDCASDLGEQVLLWRDNINQGALLGPQIFTAGRKLEGKNSIWKGDLEIANEQELLEMLDKLDGYQVDFIKITENTLSGPLFLKSVEESKKRGYLVSGHIPIDLTIEQLADAGLSSIEHASYLLRLGSDEKEVVNLLNSGTITKAEANKYYSSNFNQDTAIQAYKKLGQSNIALTPTLIGGKQLAYLDENDHQEDEFLKYLTKRFTDKYQWRIDRMSNDTEDQKQQRKEHFQLIAKQLPYIQDAGITILAGSDAAALNTFVYPALALHEELVLFQEAGLTPLQILQTATMNGAKFMGKLNSLATIEEGKEADMVILNSNPLTDIKSTQDIFGVINNGEYFNRKDLNLMLEQAKEKKIQLDKQRESNSKK